MDNFSVYCHTNKINGKKYIGLTSVAPEKRWGSNGANYGKNSIYMYNAIKKYGWDNFEHEILKTGLTKEEAKKYESYYIKQYNTLAPFGYNLTGDGEYPDIISEETKQKMRESHLGVKLSEKTKQNMSKARMGHIGYNCKPVWQCDKKTHQKIKNLIQLQKLDELQVMKNIMHIQDMFAEEKELVHMVSFGNMRRRNDLSHS